MLTRAISHRDGVTRMQKRTGAEIRRLIDSADKDNAPIAAGSHHIHHYLHLMSAIGASAEPTAPSLAIPDDEVVKFAETFLGGGTDAAPAFWLGLNPGAEYGPAKRWPSDRFLEAAVNLHESVNCGWLVFGAHGDAEAKRLADETRKRTNPDAVVDLVGRTTLIQLCAGLKFCRALLTNDSGPMHAAAALGTPVVVPFGSTSIGLTGPGLPGDSSTHKLLSANAPCSPCFLRECPVDFRCMNDLSTDQIVDAVREVCSRLSE